MDSKVGCLNECVRPNAGHQFFLADKFAVSLDQDNKKFQSPTAEAKRLTASQQKTLCRQQSEGAKANCSLLTEPVLNWEICNF
jgi:hypothetical protein